MKKLIIFITLTFLIVPSVNANTEKVQKLMEALGLVDMWSQQIELGKRQSKQMGEQAVNQMMSQLNPTDEFKKRFSDAFNNYIYKLESPWTAQEIVNVWAGLYGPHFTDEELDRLIEFYTSDLGKKDVSVTKITMTKFSEHFQKEGMSIFDKATKEFIQELQIVAKECNCRKK